MTPIDVATEKMLSGKDESIITLFFTVRQIIVESDDRLEENIKWGMPHFDLNGIMCGLGAFKNHVSLWFHKGELMKDELDLFNKGVTSKTMGQIKISQLEDLNVSGILSYVKEAIKINENPPLKKKSQKKTVAKPVVKLIEPLDFQYAIAADLIAKDFFETLTVSQKNGFLNHIEEAKTEDTKQKGILRNIERLKKVLKTIY